MVGLSIVIVMVNYLLPSNVFSIPPLDFRIVSLFWSITYIIEPKHLSLRISHDYPSAITGEVDRI